MSECLEYTTNFLEKTVLTEYKEFEQVSEQYHEDANVFKTFMNTVESSISSLSTAIDTIANALNGINDTVGESSLGVTDIAEKTSDMVEKTGNTPDGIVARFCTSWATTEEEVAQLIADIEKL